MLRVVERPETTSHFLEFPFHVCKDENELNNAIEGVNPEDIITIARLIDVKTFEPVHYFAIRDESKAFSQWMKYCAVMKPVKSN